MTETRGFFVKIWHILATNTFWASPMAHTVSSLLAMLETCIQFLQFSSVQFSHSVVSDSLRPLRLQHPRPPCPSPTPGVYSNSCPWSQWCHPTISSSIVPFSSHLQPFPASGSFPMSQEDQVNSLVRKNSWRMKRHPSPVFLPRESHGQNRLAANVHGAQWVRLHWSDLGHTL